jgi:hypothetical protein
MIQYGNKKGHNCLFLLFVAIGVWMESNSFVHPFTTSSGKGRMGIDGGGR